MPIIACSLKKKRLIWKCWLEHMFLLTTFQPNLIEGQRVPEISSSYKIYENKSCLPSKLVGKQTQQLLPCQKPHSADRRPAKTRWDVSNVHFDFKRRTSFWPNISSLNPVALKKKNHMNDFISSMKFYVGLPALAWDFTLQLLGQLLVWAILAYLTTVLSLENLALYFG